jgi:PmbA protein
MIMLLRFHAGGPPRASLLSMTSPTQASYSPFAFSQQELRRIADEALSHARYLGAQDCAVEVSEGSGINVNVRHGEVETIEQNRDKGVGVTVYLGVGKKVRRGNASTSDFNAAALRETVDAAFQIARFTAEDDCAALPEDDLLAHQARDFDLYHPWALTTEHAIELGRAAEAAAFAVSPLVRNSDGASVSAQHGQFIMMTSRGFAGGYPHSRHSLSVAPIAAPKARSPEGMERDFWYVTARNALDLPAPELVGDYAARRTLARLHSRALGTRDVPVLFEAPVAAGLLGAYSQAVSGSALYRRASFLLDSLGKKVFPKHVDIVDDPHIKGGMGSSSFDEEGVRTQRRRVVEAGKVAGYFLSTYSARKLGMQTTGNAGGSHNLMMSSRKTRDSDDFATMLCALGTGLLVTDLMGQGVNYVTGDYSRGASGFWVERGEIAYPVQEITIAGNLRDMFAGIVAIGADRIVRGNKVVGSILIDRMTVAGHA